MSKFNITLGTWLLIYFQVAGQVVGTGIVLNKSRLDSIAYANTGMVNQNVGAVPYSLIRINTEYHFTNRHHVTRTDVPLSQPQSGPNPVVH